MTGGGGGGGAGSAAGSGGAGGNGYILNVSSQWGSFYSYPGNAGSVSAGGAGGSLIGEPSGGNGGGPGQDGQPAPAPTSNNSAIELACSIVGSGGSAGPAVIGNSLITWTSGGDVRGALN